MAACNIPAATILVPMAEGVPHPSATKRSPKRRLKFNDVVLIKEENLPPMRWFLARVSALIPGRDGVCRIADLKTSTGDIRRAVKKLCLLPIKDG